MNIILVCAMGMSTGIMRMKLEEEASRLGMVAEIKAIAQSEVEDYVQSADVVLLGPQVAYSYEAIKNIMGDIPVIKIAPEVFGLMNAKKVWEVIIETLDL